MTLLTLDGTWRAAPEEPPVTAESIMASVREARAILNWHPGPERPPIARAMTMTFGGKTMPVEAVDISWTSRVRTPAPPPVWFRVAPHTYTFSCTIPLVVKARAWRRFMRALAQPRRIHPTFETLMRRASYGGRKGRRAMRRLMAMPDAAWKDGLAL